LRVAAVLRRTHGANFGDHNRDLLNASLQKAIPAAEFEPIW